MKRISVLLGLILLLGVVTAQQEVRAGKPVKQQVARQLRVGGRVLSQQGWTFTVLSDDGRQFTFLGAKSGKGLVMPNVGTTVEITYVQTPGGQLEAITFGREKAAEQRSKGQKGSIQGLKAPTAPTPAKK